MEIEVMTKQSLPALLGINEQRILEIRAQSQNLVISDTKSYDSTRQLRTEVVTMRTTLDKKRKEITKPYRDKIDEINDEAKRLTAMIEETEKPLQETVRAWEAKKEQEKKEREEVERMRVKSIKDRIDNIKSQIMHASGGDSLVVLTVLQCLQTINPEDGSFQEFTEEAKDAHARACSEISQLLVAAKYREKVALEQEAERKRLEAEREQQKKAQEAERKRLEAEREQQRRAQEEENKRLQAEREQLALEQAAERKRLEAEREYMEQQRRAHEEKITFEREAMANITLFSKFHTLLKDKDAQTIQSLINSLTMKAPKPEQFKDFYQEALEAFSQALESAKERLAEAIQKEEVLKERLAEAIQKGEMLLAEREKKAPTRVEPLLREPLSEPEDFFVEYDKDEGLVLYRKGNRIGSQKAFSWNEKDYKNSMDLLHLAYQFGLEDGKSRQP